ncbi:MAG: hypothetical protein FWG68_12485 [Defluviitaleaceae bacterium]|nr:hypothetical protein [Defluviitaleaceae bacterium]
MISVLFTEFNLDDAKEVWREEAMEDAIEEGIKKGFKEGFKEGFKRGFKEGFEEGMATKAREVAKKLLARNYPIEEIVEDTGLSHDEINQLIAED